MSTLENPELEFLHWLIRRFVEMNDIEVGSTTVKELIEKLNEELTPIGGG